MQELRCHDVKYQHISIFELTLNSDYLRVHCSNISYYIVRCDSDRARVIPYIWYSKRSKWEHIGVGPNRTITSLSPLIINNRIQLLSSMYIANKVEIFSCNWNSVTGTRSDLNRYLWSYSIVCSTSKIHNSNSMIVQYTKSCDLPLTLIFMGSDDSLSSSVTATQEYKPLWECWIGLKCNQLVEELEWTIRDLLASMCVLPSGGPSQLNITTELAAEHSRV